MEEARNSTGRTRPLLLTDLRKPLFSRLVATKEDFGHDKTIFRALSKAKSSPTSHYQPGPVSFQPDHSTSSEKEVRHWTRKASNTSDSLDFGGLKTRQGNSLKSSYFFPLPLLLAQLQPSSPTILDYPSSSTLSDIKSTTCTRFVAPQ